MYEEDLRWRGPKFLSGRMNGWIQNQLRKALPKFGPHWRKTPDGLELRLPSAAEDEDHPFKVRIFRSRDSSAWLMKVAPGRVNSPILDVTGSVKFNGMAQFAPTFNNLSIESTPAPTLQVPDEWWGETLYVYGTVTIDETIQDILSTSTNLFPEVWLYATDWAIEAVQFADMDWDNYFYFPIYDMPTGPETGDARQRWHSDITAPALALPNVD